MNNQGARGRRSTKVAMVVAVYLVVMSAGVWGLLRARRWAIATQSSTANQQAWDNWRHEAARQFAGEGPVHRRVPKSDQPPALVLLRDHFVICLAAWLVFGSLVFLSIGILLTGAIRSKTTMVDEHANADASSITI